ncbi:MAG TPA: amidohydrolase family protein [Methylomirabilota bacterium]|nr:amidohydrolase family protein [Methylomirabilota bacterium]
MATAAPWRAPFPCIDVHVHLHPPRLAAAIERHFVREGWSPGHGFDPRKVADSLAARGVTRFCCLTYAHQPGMARDLNRWMAEATAALPGAIGLGTLHPDDPDVDAVAAEATGPLGLRGFKFHHSVQRFHVDDERLFGVYERAEAAGHLLVLHVGTLPYRDPFTGVAGFRRVLTRFPRLTAIVAHMGAFESDAFLALLDAHPNLYVDTTMTLAPAAARYTGTDPAVITDAALSRWQDRILFGSDFPLIPYDYDEERRWAWDRDLPDAVRRKIFHDNAARLLDRG